MQPERLGRQRLIAAKEHHARLEQRPRNPLRDRDEQLLVGEDLDQRGVRELRQIDGAPIADGCYHLRCGSNGR